MFRNKNKIFFKEEVAENLLDAIDEASKDDKILKHNPRFIMVTDYETIVAVDDGRDRTGKIKENIDFIHSTMNELVRKMTEVSLSTNEQKDAGLLIAQSTEEINRQIEQNDFSIQEINVKLSASYQACDQIKRNFDKFKV